MKKILLLFVLCLGLNVGVSYANSSLDAPQAGDWVIYVDENGNVETFDDDCFQVTVIVGDDTIWESSGAC